MRRYLRYGESGRCPSISGGRLTPLSLPMGSPLVFLVIILLPLLLVFIFIGAIKQAFLALGVPPIAAPLLVVVAVLGSLVNIPLKEVHCVSRGDHPPVSGLYGFIYPQSQRLYSFCKTTIAINVGGAVVPLLLCAYLMVRYPGYLFPECLVTVPISVLVCYRIARIVPNVGIVMPTFVPPLVAAILATVFSRSDVAVPLAFVTGVLGVIIGADILNLLDVTNTTAPTVSIGGAGTFDGIFLTGIISVLLV